MVVVVIAVWPAAGRRRKKQRKAEANIKQELTVVKKDGLVLYILVISFITYLHVTLFKCGSYPSDRKDRKLLFQLYDLVKKRFQLSEQGGKWFT
jgi:hypothetical protein